MIGDERADSGNSLAGWAPVCGDPIGTVPAEVVLFEEEDEDGPIFILQLADFLGALGSSPAHTLSCMQEVCETVFREHLEPQESYSLHGVAFYVFRFRDIDPKEARQRAHRIVEEVGHRLLGGHFRPFTADQQSAAPDTEAATTMATRDTVHQETAADWKARTAPDGVAQDFAGDDPGFDEHPDSRRYRSAKAYEKDIDRTDGAQGTPLPSRRKRAAST